MKRFVCILLACALVFNIFGYYFIFLLDRMAVRKEMKEMIRSGCFRDYQEIISITDPIHNRDFLPVNTTEFRYKGRLYDVISKKYIGNAILFTCINDRKEETLTLRFASLSDIMNGFHSPDHDKRHRAMVHTIIKIALMTILVKPGPDSCREIPFRDLCYRTAIVAESVDPPPPKTC